MMSVPMRIENSRVRAELCCVCPNWKQLTRWKARKLSINNQLTTGIRNRTTYFRRILSLHKAPALLSQRNVCLGFLSVFLVHLLV